MILPPLVFPGGTLIVPVCFEKERKRERETERKRERERERDRERERKRCSILHKDLFIATCTFQLEWGH
jgi:hypothetical protein